MVQVLDQAQPNRLLDLTHVRRAEVVVYEATAAIHTVPYGARWQRKTFLPPCLFLRTGRWCLDLHVLWL